MTRCKVGDLAVRIKQFSDSFVPSGSVVRCLRIRKSGLLYGPDGSSPIACTNVWEVEWNGRRVGDLGMLLVIPDDHLLPIRDPGEDAQDETLLWKPVPSTVKETA